MIIQSGESLTAQLAGTKSYICTDYQTKRPKVNDEGLQQFSLPIQIPGLYRLEQYSVKVFAKADPLDGAAIGDSVELTGVAVQLGYLVNESGNRQQFWTLSAETATLKKAKA